MASKAWMQSFLSASHVLRHGLIILSFLQGEARTEQPTSRISGVHSPFSSPWMTLRRRYSAPDSASIRLRWPRMFGNIVLKDRYLQSGSTVDTERLKAAWLTWNIPDHCSSRGGAVYIWLWEEENYIKLKTSRCRRMTFRVDWFKVMTPVIHELCIRYI